ncbi:urotensin 2, alpha [Neoarius graeffei]|uniref:urotensin 2, alpha n=1 Tax=Neoarius graeffei TaxID=443677 RepID=UPI00298D2158|nr:urotensin 2, alpha [Neoarius graeffei]
MVYNLILSWTLLLLSIGPLLAHPVSETVDMSYPGPGSAEEAGAVGPEDLDLSSILQRTTGLSYSPLLPKDGLRVSGLLPQEALKEVLLEKPGHLSSLSHILGIKRPYRKRGNGPDCFWKYCV